MTFLARIPGRTIVGVTWIAACNPGADAVGQSDGTTSGPGIIVELTGSTSTSTGAVGSTSTGAADGSSSGTPPPVCGDGEVDPGEACDDGNDDDDDACLAGCVPATCGDGVVRAGVEACDDANDDNTDACLDDCKAAFCGDGFVQLDVEECDDANDVDEDACNDDCILTFCGDGYVQIGEECDDLGDSPICDEDCTPAYCGDGDTNHVAGEECDDANASMADNCYPSCKAPTMLIFATSQRFFGDLGGIDGADQICQAAAESGGFGGTFRAWLALNEAVPGDRIVHSPGRYMLPNKVAVANNFDQLASGYLLAPIGLTEKGAFVDDYAWTGHIEPEKNWPGSTCNEWTGGEDYLGLVSELEKPEFVGASENAAAFNCAQFQRRVVCVQEPWYGPYPE